jgi:hypothetical protein
MVVWVALDQPLHCLEYLLTTLVVVVAELVLALLAMPQLAGLLVG